MTDMNPVHLAVVLDRSGSMSAIADDMVGGFNQLLGEQRSGDGAVVVTLAQFDGHEPFELLMDAVPIHDVLDLERSQFVPRGSTPLYDAVGRMIAHLDARVAQRAQDQLGAEDQIVVVVTDGFENASTEHGRDSVFSLIEDRRGKEWTFVFLGANQDAYTEGGSMGIQGGATAAWDPTGDGTRDMWSKTSRSVTEFRDKDADRRALSKSRFLEQADADRPLTPFGPLSEPGAIPPKSRSYWVVADRLLAGAYPFHADVDRGRSTLGRLLEVGVDTFVDLTMAHLDQSTDAFLTPYEPHLPSARRPAEVLHHPIVDLAVPTESEMVSILDDIDQRLAEGRVVYVHCWGGIGRTGTVIGCWLVRHGVAAPGRVLDTLAALREADQGGGERRSPETSEQRTFVRGWQEGR